MISRTEISSFQLIFLLIHGQIGVGVITLPYDIFVKAKSDAWISVLITGIIVQIFILIYGCLLRRFPDYSLFDICIHLLGKFVGRIFILLFVLSYLSVVTITMSKFSYFIKTWMMPMTPKWILLSILCFIVIFIVIENIQIIARFSFLMSIVFIGFFVVSLYTLQYINITHILPIGSSGITSITKGVAPALFSFQGFEFLLIIHPFIKATPRNIIKATTIANIFTTLFYTMLVIITLLYFSADELKIVPEPVLYLMKSFTSRIIERPDLLFTSMWIVLVVTTLIITVYGGTLGILTTMHSTNLRNYTILFTFVSLLLSLSLYDKYLIDVVSKIYNYTATSILLFMPVFLLLIAIIFRKKKEVTT